MLAACIHLQVAHLRSPQTRAGQHAFHGFLDNEFGIFFEIFGRRGQPNASRIARMTDILLVRELLPGQSHLLGVDDDDIVTAVNVRSETRLFRAGFWLPGRQDVPIPRSLRRSKPIPW